MIYNREVKFDEYTLLGLHECFQFVALWMKQHPEISPFQVLFGSIVENWFNPELKLKKVFTVKDIDPSTMKIRCKEVT